MSILRDVHVMLMSYRSNDNESTNGWRTENGLKVLAKAMVIGLIGF